MTDLYKVFTYINIKMCVAPLVFTNLSGSVSPSRRAVAPASVLIPPRLRWPASGTWVSSRDADSPGDGAASLHGAMPALGCLKREVGAAQAPGLILRHQPQLLNEGMGISQRC